MAEVLEKIAERRGSRSVSKKRDYSGQGISHNKGYSTFAEMYLEEPADAQATRITCSICTWRKVPTIDDW